MVSSADINNFVQAEFLRILWRTFYRRHPANISSHFLPILMCFWRLFDLKYMYVYRDWEYRKIEMKKINKWMRSHSVWSVSLSMKDPECTDYCAHCFCTVLWECYFHWVTSAVELNFLFRKVNWLGNKRKTLDITQDISRPPSW